MLDLRGTVLAEDETEILKHPLVGGVILFSRNYENPEQLNTLCQAIHAVRTPRLLLAVDHEGGRVQRFRQGFTDLPACRVFGECYEQDPKQGLTQAETAGWLMAAELRAYGVDFSFAPVLDLFKGISEVIGDRAFHRKAEDAARLARSYMKGMHAAGMAAVGKHFPGHGAVVEDSHHAIPIDNRRFEDIQMDDLLVFQRLIDHGLPAVMPAHVIYSEIDERPAGFSSIWLKQILRQQLNFNGAIFSDDISMAGAEVMGDYTARARAALDAGCDMVLVCNQPEEAINVLDNLKHDIDPSASVRLMQMHGKPAHDSVTLMASKEWQQASELMQSLTPSPELKLGDDETA